MWKILLLIAVFNGDELTAVVEPIPGQRFETMAVCARVGAKIAATPLPAGQHAVPVCVDSTAP